MLVYLTFNTTDDFGYFGLFCSICKKCVNPLWRNFLISFMFTASEMIDSELTSDGKHQYTFVLQTKFSFVYQTGCCGHRIEA